MKEELTRIGMLGVLAALVLTTACSREVVGKRNNDKADRALVCAEYEKWVVYGRWRKKSNRYRWVSNHPRKTQAYWIDGHWTGFSKGRR